MDKQSLLDYLTERSAILHERILQNIHERGTVAEFESLLERRDELSNIRQRVYRIR